MKIRSLRLIAVALCALPLVRLAAQDVTVGELRWHSSDPAPEVMPKMKSRWRPDYPEDLRKLDEIGYVIMAQHIDAAGKRMTFMFEATHLPFRRAVEAELRGWEVVAGKQGNEPVVSFVWMPVIFNPKTAAVKGAEATPRLLAVTPVVTKERVAPTGQPPVVRMKLSIDAEGAITRAEPEGEVKPAVAAVIREALKGWKFAPARAGGAAVAAEITMPVLCERPAPADIGQRSPPKVLKQTRPDYPMALRRAGLRGEVVLDFEVDTDGRVRNPVVVTSNSPAFDEPAITALRQWTFQPAQQNGKPVKAKLRVPIIFELGGGGRDAYQVQEKVDQKKLPEELRYDTPAKIIGAMVPIYPYELRRTEVRGTAKAVMIIDTRGRVTEVKIVTAERPEFGLALVAALEGFAFDPALKNGKPVMHMVSYEHNFDAFAAGDPVGDELLGVEQKHPERIVGAAKLDAPLKPVSRRAPVSPKAWPEGVQQGEALIEILIDRDGRVRLPRIESATAESFGYAAMQAVSAWQFEPALSGGKPAVVRAKVPFKFSLKDAKAPAAPSPMPASAEKAESAK